MKKIIAILLTIATMLSLAIAAPVSADAASAKTKALKAYKKYLVKEKKKGNTYMFNGVNDYERFSIIYLDNNSVPELVLQKGSHYTVYTYKKGKVKKTAIDYFYTLTERFAYYKKTSLYECCSMRFGIAYYSYIKLAGLKTNQKMLKESDVYGSGGTKYYVNSKKTTKAKYNKTFKKLTKGRSLKKAKFHKNNAKNRKKFLKK